MHEHTAHVVAQPRTIETLGGVSVRYHGNYGHGLRPGASASLSCPNCTREDTGHRCEVGPLCEQMETYLDVMTAHADDPISAHYGVYPPLPDFVTSHSGARMPLDECEHWSCLGIVNAHCETCQAEAWADYCAEVAR